MDGDKTRVLGLYAYWR